MNYKYSLNIHIFDRLPVPLHSEGDRLSWPTALDTAVPVNSIQISRRIDSVGDSLKKRSRLLLQPVLVCDMLKGFKVVKGVKYP